MVRDLAERLGAIFCGADVDLRIDSRSTLKAFRNLLCEVAGVVLANQVNGASAKAAAGHAAAAKTGQAFGGLDHDIELTAADFVEVAQAGVRFPHEFADASEVAVY